MGGSLAGKAQAGISCSHYPGTLDNILVFVRGVDVAGFHQETPFGVEILQESRMRIHTGHSRRMMDGLVLVLRIGMRAF